MASAVHTGRTTQVWDAEVTGAGGRKLALFRCTQMILWPRRPDSRTDRAMPEAQQFLLFIPVAALFTLAPGPDSLMLLARALGQGTRAGVASAAGCALGILVTSILVAAGLSAVVAASESLFLILRGAGAAYLVWVGIRPFAARP